MSLVDIGPEAFTNSDETVICFKGQNYYRSCDKLVKEDHYANGDTGASYCLKRVDHPGEVHEDWAGNTRESDKVTLIKPEMFDDQTMAKVHDALLGTGLDVQTAIDAVTNLQNSGILFRERNKVSA